MPRSERASRPGPAAALAIDVANGNILTTYVNSDRIAVGALTAPWPPVAIITDVCGATSGSPGDAEISAAGDLYVGCSNNVVAIDIVAIAAASLAGVSGTLTADSLGAVRHVIPPVAPLSNFNAGWLSAAADTFARPKSSTFTASPPPTMMLAGFRSRCTRWGD